MQAILPLAADVLLRPAALDLIAIGCLGCLWWRFMDVVLGACAHGGAGREVRHLRRAFNERRLGVDRRNPDRRGSPPPLPVGERRRGGDRRKPGCDWSCRSKSH